MIVTRKEQQQQNVTKISGCRTLVDLPRLPELPEGNPSTQAAALKAWRHLRMGAIQPAD